jgi:hypothetical protein
MELLDVQPPQAEVGDGERIDGESLDCMIGHLAVRVADQHRLTEQDQAIADRDEHGERLLARRPAARVQRRVGPEHLARRDVLHRRPRTDDLPQPKATVANVEP